MVLKRPVPSLGVEIVCDGRTLQVVGVDGNTIEEHEVEASSYVEIFNEIGKMEDELVAAATAMEGTCTDTDSP